MPLLSARLTIPLFVFEKMGASPPKKMNLALTANWMIKWKDVMDFGRKKYPCLVALRDPGLQFVHVLHATINACHSGLQPQTSIEDTNITRQIKHVVSSK